ncbi:metal-sensitive transcriptional regulator [Streptomyces maremycinicus]|uniref:metal-sensitive transcriptional regulator n=1 Tax=Streptomyces maremycinicus TaxID=1679753 RepID=UPI0007895F68|nr:metal-sensitive transcriptional regulator [Streptomyces sp. NBRC 110468]
MTTASGRGLRPQVSEPPGYHSHKADHLSRLHKIEGQVRGVARMVDEDRYCIDVLTQIGAVTHALQEVALGLLDDHARHCVLDAAKAEPAEADAKFDEITVALRRALRL